eukprot:540789_1
MFFLVMLIALVLSQINGEQHSMNGTVYYNSKLNEYNLTLNVIDCVNGACCGYFSDTLNVTGWGILEVKTGSNKNINDTIKMYSCGYLEGYLSSYEINTYYDTVRENNNELYVFGRDWEKWYNAQSEWMNNKILTNKNDEYWIFMNLLELQFKGLYDGYNIAANKYNLKSLKMFDFSWINAMDDYSDIAAKLIFDNTSLKYNNLNYNNYGAHTHSHCSGLVKVTPTFDNIYFSHD